MEIIHNPVTDAILDRRSIRSYTDEALTEDEVHTLLQCGLRAPSAHNRQTTRFAAVRDRKLLEKLRLEMTEAAEEPSRWLKAFHYGAPCVIFLFDRRGDRWSGINGAIAAENIHVAAQGLGLGSVLIGIIRDFMLSERGEAWKARFGIPEDYDFVLAVAVGHPDKPGRDLPRDQENIVYVKGEDEP